MLFGNLALWIRRVTEHHRVPSQAHGRDLWLNTQALLSGRRGNGSAPPRQTLQPAATGRQHGKLVLVGAQRSREKLVSRKRPVERRPRCSSARRCSRVRRTGTWDPPWWQACPALSCGVRSRATAKNEPRKKNGSYPRTLPPMHEPPRFASRTRFSRGSRAACSYVFDL